MGINIDGARDLVSATDGSLTIEGQSVNTTGIMTASGGIKVGTAATIHSTGQFNIGVAATIFTNGNATFAGILTAASFSGIDLGAVTGATGDFSIADKIVHTGDTNTTIRFPSADTFTIETAGGEAVRVNSSQQVGISSQTPDRGLTVYKDSVARINIKSLNTSNTGIEFGDQNDHNAGYITYDNTDNSFAVGLNGTGEKVSIDSNGNVSLASSLAVTGVTTAGAFIPSSGWLGNRRININGAMQVWQRSTSASDIGGSNGYFACDRYRSSNNGSGRHTISRDTDEPGGFAYSMKIDVTTAVASPSANNYMFIQHRLTGHDVQPFAKGTSSAQKYALSFWVKSPKTGVHVVQLEDVENSRSVQGSYTIASANTWEKHTIIYPAETSNGITGDSSHRMQLYFWLFAGSTYNNGNVASLGTTWGSTGTTSRASGQVNCFDNTSNNFYITGIQFEVGSYATPFEHASYDAELRKCQYYYYKEHLDNNDFYTGMGMADIDGNSVILNLPFPVEMRQEPSLETTGDEDDYMIRRSTTQQCTSVPTIGGASTKRQAALVFTKSSHGWGDGSAVRCGAWGTSYLGFNAEL